MKDIDNILATLRTEIPDNGFTERVMNAIPRHYGLSRNFYRIPTLVAAAASLLLFVMLSVGGLDYSSAIGKISGKYAEITNKITPPSQAVQKEYDPFDF